MLTFNAYGIDEQMTTAMVTRFLPALITFVIGLIAIKVVLHFVRAALAKSKLDKASHLLIVRIVKIALWLLLVLSVLAFLDVNMAPFVTVLGAGGVAIALALRDSLSNVAGGIILIVTKPFSQGDEVEIEGVKGYVDTIDLMTTHLHKYDNTEIIMPNSKASTAIIVNYTRRDLRSIMCELTLGYGEDLEKVRAIALDVIRDSHMLLEDPEPWFNVRSNAADGVEMVIYVWCKTEDRYKAASYFNEEIKNRLMAENIEIAYPHLTVDLTNEKQG